MVLTVRQNIFGMIAVAFLGIAAAAAIAERELAQAFDDANYAYINSLPSVDILQKIKSAFASLRFEVYRAVVQRGQEAGLKSPDEQHALIDDLVTLLDSYATTGCGGGNCFADQTDQARFDDARVGLLAAIPRFERVIAAEKRGDFDAARAALILAVADGQLQEALIDRDIDYNEKVAQLTSERATQTRRQVQLTLAALFLAILGIVGVIGAGVARRLTRSLGGEPAAASHIVDRIADGDLDVAVPVAPGDHTSLLARIKVMSAALSSLADRAVAIGAGDLDGTVELLSDRDKLGHAINAMTQNLRQARDTEDRRRWIQDGVAELIAALTGDFSLQQLAELAVATVGRRLSAGRGVLYCVDRDGALELIGSYMFSADPRLAGRFAPGEGAIGQVAREGKPIFLTEVPDDAAPIVTGTSRHRPLFTYTMPLQQDGKLIGVMEFASYEAFDGRRLDYLEAAALRIGTLLFVAEQRERVTALLAQAEQAERDMRGQRDALQSANMRMEEQQQQLQQQSEELQQSNAQMEEQQQQLQQQSEELRQSNDQLERQQMLLETRNAELRGSEAELAKRAELLERSSRYKSEFLANMSHELRTPLNAIILLSQLMIRESAGRLTEEDLRRIEVVLRSGQELLRLINDVLDLAKVEAGRAEIRASLRSSREITAHLQELFETTARERGLSFTIADDLGAEIESDHDKLGQILRNLLSNALKFTRSGGITLAFKRIEDQALPIRISVADTGIGIAPENEKLIFEAFRQVDGSASREFSGTGLGLTISARFAELLGGAISVESEVGRGSVFTVALPDHPPASGHPPAPPPPAAPPALSDDRAGIGPGDRPLLLIDDDREFGGAVLAMMRRGGQKSLVAATAEEGLALTRRFRPAGILLDLGLPDRDGADLLREIKGDPDLRGIPVYIVSARDRDDALIEAGASDFLSKPVDESRLAAVATGILGGASKSGGILIAGKSTLDATHLNDLLESPSGQIAHHPTATAALKAMRDGDWRLVIIDMSGQTMAQVLKLAEAARTTQPGPAILFYGAKAVPEEDEAALRRYSDAIVVRAPQSERRLQREIARILREAPKPGLAASAAPEGSRRLEGRTILVVDDDPRNLFVLTSALEQNGAQVETATGAKTALRILAERRFDLLITDIMMPEMDGYQLTAECRASPATAAMPIIALTAKAMPTDREHAFAAGCSDYLSKPVDYDILLNMADLWCRREE